MTTEEKRGSGEVRKRSAPRSRIRSLLIWCLISFLAVFGVLVGVGIWGAHWLRSNARARAVELLSQRFDDVQLSSLDFAVRPTFDPLPSFSAVGKGLRLSLKGRQGAPPFLEIEEFKVEVGLKGLWSDPVRIRKLDLNQMEIQISPRKRTGDQSGAGSAALRQTPVFVFDRLIADGAVLLIHSRNPEKEPLEFDLHQLRMTSVGPRSPMKFEAELDNAKPPGRIRTTGVFGPLTLPDPGGSPVGGKYVFEGADLSDLGGIGGTLDSDGEFSGVLEHIEVQGTTRTPDFYLKPVGTPVNLETEFKAVVDGTSGDTFLDPIKVRIESSKFTANGSVAGKPGEKGKTIDLQADGTDGRIEDFLKLAVKTDQPLLTGILSFDSKILIPPGKVDVLEKLQLKGHFQIRSTEFPIPAVQEKVNLLSELGRGDRPKREGPAPKAVVSDISGEFLLSKGLMQVRRLRFKVPGATVALNGDYSLVDESVNFRGELLTEAKVSQMTGGIKSLLLKPIDPLFKRRGAGAVIPIKIEGTRSDISFGVEKGRILSRDDVTEDDRVPQNWK